MNRVRLRPTMLSLNQRALKLYASEGFVEEGRLREAVRVADGYDTLVVMSMLDREYEARVAMELEADLTAG